MGLISHALRRSKRINLDMRLQEMKMRSFSSNIKSTQESSPIYMSLINSISLLLPPVSKANLPAVLTIAGSDNSGGAGIEADLKTFTAHKVYGLDCITALTAQNTTGVSAVVETPKEHLQEILAQNFSDFADGYKDIPLKVIKTGMLTQAAVEVLNQHIEYINKKEIRLVIDPVMVATSGSILSDNNVMKRCLETLFPSAFLITPNFEEAEHIWKTATGDTSPLDIETVEDFTSFVVKLQRTLNCQNLLVKGGHIPFRNGRRNHGNLLTDDLRVIDVLYESNLGTTTVYLSQYIVTNNSHGTGCTLASSISANLAKGKPLRDAVALSIHYVHKGMVSVTGNLGHGNGPLNHAVQVDESVRDIIGGQVQIKGLLFEYLKTNERVRDNWEEYTKHKFVSLVAANMLPFDDFLYYLKQDYYYLINYAKMHGTAASVSPDCEQIQIQAKIIGNIMTEIEKHKLKLLDAYNVDYGHADLDKELHPGKACIAYCDYLLNVGRTEDFLGIKVALAPCLHGYAEAGMFGREVKERNSEPGIVTEKQSEAYASWLLDYTAEWYREAHEEGISSLDAIFQSQAVLAQRMDELCTLFNDVVKLEVAFWDEVVNRGESK